eukprot:gnl/TRDRNA2_/TRDRNA2_181334_c0_seq1.p1 gnl/TRDRNA2_/TRDRNA2_181334_c0~~gnl/TRDRNA2_/TRDRNA2_181334_c0_seq1.p1  ORF type:complete len:728 (-),score=160.81 gnl/TRDRNA2_/TRDRNA2_181334_c0_seq1:46-2229(-)
MPAALATLRGKPCIASYGQIEGTKRRQPRSGSPGAERRPDRDALRRSGSIVLSTTGALDRGANSDTSAAGLLAKKPTTAGWQRKPDFLWSHPAFLEEMPARLEGCRKRLVAADMELRRYYADEMSRNCEWKRQLDEAFRQNSYFQEESKLLKKQQEAGAILPSATSKSTTYASSGSESRSWNEGEPEREPQVDTSSVGEARTQSAMDQSSSSFWSGGDLEMLGARDADDLRTQLSSIERNLRDLDKKWRASEQHRSATRATQEDLSSRLKVSEENHRTTVRESEQRLKSYEDEIEKLRKDLGVSEAESQSLRNQLNQSSSQAETLNSEAKKLNGRIDAFQGKVEELSTQLQKSEVDRQDLEAKVKILHTEKEEISRKERQGSHDAERRITELFETVANVRQERADLAERLAAAEAAATEKEAAADRRLKATEERLKATEERLKAAETQATSAALQETKATPSKMPAAAKKKQVPEARSKLKEALFLSLDVDGIGYVDCEALMPFVKHCRSVGSQAEWAKEFTALCQRMGADATKGLSMDNFFSFVDEGDLYCSDDELRDALISIEAAAGAEAEELASLVALATACDSAVPELVFTAESPSSEADAVTAELKPTQCKLLPSKRELHLVPLVPKGAVRVVALKDVKTVTQPDSASRIIDLSMLTGSGSGTRFCVHNENIAATFFERLEAVVNGPPATEEQEDLGIPMRPGPGCSLASSESGSAEEADGS